MRKLIVFLCLMALPVWAQQIPANNGKYIMDTANVLGSRQLSEINEKLANIEKNVTDHPQVLALIVPTVGDLGIDDFSTKVFEAWKPGTKEKDNGLLLVIATQDRKVAIRTGGGTGYRITEPQTRQITDAMKPNLQASDWYNAILVYADKSESILKGTQETASEKKTESNNWFWWVFWIATFCGGWLLVIQFKQHKNNMAKIKSDRVIKEAGYKAERERLMSRAQPIIKSNKMRSDTCWNQGPGKSTVKPATKSTYSSSTDDGITGAVIGGIIGASFGSDNSSPPSTPSASYDSGGGTTDAGGSSDSF